MSQDISDALSLSEKWKDNTGRINFYKFRK